MRIINKTGRAIIVFMQMENGWDDREEVLEPGEMSDWWLHLETDDVIEIKLPKKRKRNRKK